MVKGIKPSMLCFYIKNAKSENVKLFSIHFLLIRDKDLLPTKEENIKEYSSVFWFIGYFHFSSKAHTVLISSLMWSKLIYPGTCTWNSLNPMIPNKNRSLIWKRKKFVGKQNMAIMAGQNINY